MKEHPPSRKKAHRAKSPDAYPGAEAFLPPRATLKSLAAAAQDCRGCPLYADATQAVFGAGRKKSRLMLVGEQPGNDEDRAGAPFVGPAGKLLDRALAAAGIARAQVYVTNVVKHFKFELRGKRRIHSKPGMREINACLAWLERELALVRPQVLVCLGATAAQALIGRGFRITQRRGEIVATPWCERTLATAHPSSILRQPDPEARGREFAALVADLKIAARLLD